MFLQGFLVLFDCIYYFTWISIVFCSSNTWNSGKEFLRSLFPPQTEASGYSILSTEKLKMFVLPLLHNTPAPYVQQSLKTERNFLVLCSKLFLWFHEKKLWHRLQVSLWTDVAPEFTDENWRHTKVVALLCGRPHGKLHHHRSKYARIFNITKKKTCKKLHWPKHGQSLDIVYTFLMNP